MAFRLFYKMLKPVLLFLLEKKMEMELLKIIIFGAKIMTL